MTTTATSESIVLEIVQQPIDANVSSDLIAWSDPTADLSTSTTVIVLFGAIDRPALVKIMPVSDDFTSVDFLVNSSYAIAQVSRYLCEQQIHV